MIKNYIKIAFRNIIRQKMYSAINIGGLAIGLGVCITIMMYVSHEMTYDRFQKDGERIFGLQAALNMGGNKMNVAYMSYATGPVAQQTQPGVESYLRTMLYYKPLVVTMPQSPQQKIIEQDLLFADAGFFDFFSYKLLAGSKKDVLIKPFSVVISKNMANKYFGKENPVGKTITIKTDSTYTYQVTGVAENSPSNSSIKYNFIVSNQTLPIIKEGKNAVQGSAVGPGSHGVYLKLKNVSDTAGVKRGLETLAKNNKVFEGLTFSLTALPDMHLKSNFGDSSNTKYLKIFPLVALLILLLALVNYMSLSTARSTLRAKEVGVRKVSGAGRKTIAIQFYIESAIFTLIAFILGYVLCYALRPWFTNVLQLQIDSSFLYSPLVLSLLAALFVVTVVIAGGYPSLVLSAFKPADTLKGKMSLKTGGATVRKVFTTFQFAISVGLIVCGIIIDRQLYFFRHTDTGVDRENVLMIPVTNSFGSNYPAFKRDVQSLAGIANTATSHYAMFKGYDMLFISGKTKEESVALANLTVDENYVNTLNLKWKIPPISPAALKGKNKVVINEQAINELHLKANPVGSFIESGEERFEVTGVLKNFNFSSMQSAIQPLGLFIAPDTTKVWAKVRCELFAKITPNTNLPTLLERLQSIYKKYDSETPFSYTFMDDAFNEQYKAEDRLASIFSIFTYITVALAAMGLFGLTAFTIQQRSKEISIRKVLGASVSTITSLLSADLVKLVILSVVLASPVAWWAMHSWLQNFAYRIDISWWMFVTAGTIAVITAVATISYHAIKAAIANPVKSLRSE
ncbi:ABC transporter permease [Mucilaginibacter terrenus]|uniref:ABC transporter permease n=1 Tax=Mucilaginibacter terrenus TaxID=2482727 RepID=A0A3E2NTY9_9SPHI|nr:ABC transporter permease [Mucilaginibacter terrenus]RFZ84476.1 ABC transporter permease [Mucilaginibacter terrenus]